MYKARIRGIYATALTKLALDWGFKVVQPTEKVARRFGLEPDFSPPDITVKDHESKTGVVALGLCEALEAFLTRLVEYADPVVAKARARLKEVFVGRAVGSEMCIRDSRYVLTPGAVGVYTVVRPPIGPLKGAAAPEIVVEGQYVELNTTGRVSYSEHIPAEEAVRLRILAETRLRQYASIGLRFKSSARYATDDDIAAEAEALYKELLEISKGGSPGQVLRRGECFAVVLFDSASKARLDEARAAAVPTVRGHHALRAQGLGKCLDLLDHVGGDVYEKAAEFLAGEASAVYHIRPWGEVVEMRAEPVGVRNGVLVLKRRLRPGGVLDGIGVKIERGFYALTCVPRGEGYVVHTYYTGEGRAVGTYINANTVPEWGRRVIYIDLLVDKAFDGGGERVLDLEEYEKFAEMFPQRLRDPLSRLPKTPLVCTEEGIKAVA